VILRRRFAVRSCHRRKAKDARGWGSWERGPKGKCRRWQRRSLCETKPNLGGMGYLGKECRGRIDAAGERNAQTKPISETRQGRSRPRHQMPYGVATNGLIVRNKANPLLGRWWALATLPGCYAEQSQFAGSRREASGWGLEATERTILRNKAKCGEDGMHREDRSSIRVSPTQEWSVRNKANLGWPGSAKVLCRKGVMLNGLIMRNKANSGAGSPSSDPGRAGTLALLCKTKPIWRAKAGGRRPEESAWTILWNKANLRRDGCTSCRDGHCIEGGRLVEYRGCYWVQSRLGISGPSRQVNTAMPHPVSRMRGCRYHGSPDKMLCAVPLSARNETILGFG
jgi:hypothetical protein